MYEISTAQNSKENDKNKVVFIGTVILLMAIVVFALIKVDVFENGWSPFNMLNMPSVTANAEVAATEEGALPAREAVKERRVKSERYTEAGVLQYYNTFEFNEENLPTQEKSFYESDAPGLYTDFSYDAQGYLLQEICYFKDGTEYYRTQYTYNPNGTMKEKVTVDAGVGKAPKQNQVVQYDYQDDRKIIQARFYDENSTQIAYADYKYDENGYLNCYIKYNTDATMLYYLGYEVNAYGDETKQTYYAPDGSVQNYTLYYYEEV